MNKVNCFCCNEELHNQEYEDMEEEVYPMGGIQFKTYGHYGTTIFDPMGSGTILELAICDECLKKNKNRLHGSGKKEALETIGYLEQNRVL